MFLSRGCAVILLFFFWVQPQLWAQNQSETGDTTEPVSLVGLTLAELIQRFGMPRSVHAVRGLEEWQDDVVFVYELGDFYIYKNRVWQMGLKAALGIRLGDTYGTIAMVLGPGVEKRGDSVFYPLDEGSWPLMLRYDFDKAGRIQAIFIYRTDF